MNSNPATSIREWFDQQVAQIPAHRTIEIDGRHIHVRTWDSPREAHIVLVHGGAANGAWWDPIAPSLRHLGHVHALDLGGQGLSDWATDYSLDSWGHEVAEFVNDVAVADTPVVLIGHSRGGFVSLIASARTSVPPRGLILIESAFNVDPPPAKDVSHSPRAPRSPLTRAELVSRFRPLPHDIPSLDFVLQHVAEQAVVERDGRWQWQLDKSFLGRVPAMRLEEAKSTDVPLVQIRGNHGLLDAHTAESARQVIQPDSPIEIIEQAGHHILLQKPRELAQRLAAHTAAFLSIDDGR